MISKIFNEGTYHVVAISYIVGLVLSESVMSFHTPSVSNHNGSNVYQSHFLELIIISNRY